MTDINDLFPIPDFFDNWQLADDLYRSCEPDMLVRMLLSRKAIPKLQRKLLADIVGGKVKLPSKRGKKNSKLTYEQRNQIYLCVQNLKSMYKFNKGDLDEIAEKNKMEVADLKKLCAEVRTDLRALLARLYGISETSVMTIARRFKPVPMPITVVSKRVGKKRQ